MRCPYCEEYDVDDLPVGVGDPDNICEYCHEYSIPVERENHETIKGTQGITSFT